jgi:hypothetical protein
VHTAAVKRSFETDSYRAPANGSRIGGAAGAEMAPLLAGRNTPRNDDGLQIDTRYAGKSRGMVLRLGKSSR